MKHHPEKRTTIRQLMRKFDLGRTEVEHALGDLPFELGANNTHFFETAKAEELVSAAAETMTAIKRLRLQKLKAEVDLVQQKSDDYNRNHIRVEDSVATLDTLNKSFWSAVRNSGFLSYPQELQLQHYVEHSVLDSMRAAGIGDNVIAPRAAALHDAEKKFNDDLKAGKIPEDWDETYQPTNFRRVWSKELGRYMTRREIISKFGQGAQISPIDEILDEEPPRRRKRL